MNQSCGFIAYSFYYCCSVFNANIFSGHLHHYHSQGLPQPPELDDVQPHILRSSFQGDLQDWLTGVFRLPHPHQALHPVLQPWLGNPLRCRGVAAKAQQKANEPTRLKFYRSLQALLSFPVISIIVNVSQYIPDEDFAGVKMNSCDQS
jgi:hypothetical protein